MREMMSRMRREPLFWFLLAGLLLFALHRALGGGEGDERHIRIDREKLLEFIQLRARSFNETAASARLEDMAPADVAALVEELKREEAMYREALRLGLDANDYVLRRRLVQSLEYVAGEEQADLEEPTEAQLRRYYEANRERYATMPAVSFSHAFFSAERHGDDEAQRLAKAALRKLNASGAAPAGLPGDRFLYQPNYAERSPELIASHFGEVFAKALFALPADAQGWQGPLRSDHGYHLVKIVGRSEGRPLSFAQARATVEEDFAGDAVRQHREAFVEDVLSRYSVDIGGDLQRLMEGRE